MSLTTGRLTNVTVLASLIGILMKKIICFKLEMRTEYFVV